MNQDQNQLNDKSKVKTLPYILAWIGFIALALSGIVEVFKNLKPPARDEYEK